MIETESDFFVNINIGLYFYLLIIFSIALTIKFVLQRRKQDFDFHLAKAYFAVGSQKHDELEEFKYLILLLNAYNRFLEKNIKLEIKDIMRIYPIMISASAEQKIVIRESIGKALEKDKLELARQLPELFNWPDKEHFLTKERLLLNQTLRDVFTILIPAVISIATFIIGLLATLNREQSNNSTVVDQSSQFLIALTASA